LPKSALRIRPIGIERLSCQQLYSRPPETRRRAVTTTASRQIPVGNIIQVYELWQDSDLLAAHFDHPNYFDMVEVFREAKFVESVNRCYLTEREEPVYGPEGANKTAFFT